MQRRKALVVGINDYPGGNRLNGCVNDATEIAELLEMNQDGSPNFSVRLKTDVMTKSELLADIHALFCEGDEDIALFYFSGHGSDLNSGVIVTPDANDYDLGVSMGDLLRMANTSRHKNKIIILDCCYSGKFGITANSNSTEAVLGEGVTIITASRKDELSYEKNIGKDEISIRGVFTNLLIQALKGGAADVSGNITPASLYSFVDQSLGVWEQRPLFKTNISRFLPIRSIEPKVSKKILRKLKEYFKDMGDIFALDPSFEYTNTPEVEHSYILPYADENNVAIFKDLQKFESVGLVEPVDEEHMYFAAMNSTGCRLTPLGQHYWKLSRDQRF